AVENGLRDAERAPKPGHDAAHRRRLDVSSRVADEVYVTVTEPAMIRDPPLIDWNPRRLKCERIQTTTLEKTLERGEYRSAVVPDQPRDAVRRRFWNQPVEVASVGRIEPDARCLRAQIHGQSDEGLYQRNRRLLWPSHGAGHRTEGAVGTNQRAETSLFGTHAGAERQRQGPSVSPDSKEPTPEYHIGTSGLRMLGQRANEGGTLDDQIGPLQRHGRDAAVCEHLEPVNPVHDGLVGEAPEDIGHTAGHDERSRAAVYRRR